MHIQLAEFSGTLTELKRYLESKVMEEDMKRAIDEEDALTAQFLSEYDEQNLEKIEREKLMLEQEEHEAWKDKK